MPERDGVERYVQQGSAFYECPPELLTLAYIGAEGGVNVPEEDKAKLLRQATWEELPDIPEGRSGYMRRASPLIVPGSFPIKLYQLKGVGGRKGNLVLPPDPEEEYLQDDMPLLQMRFDGNGRPFPMVLPPSPFGGLLPREGEMEFGNNKRLFNAGLAVPAPILFGEYGCACRGGNMEFCVAGLPFDEDMRAAIYFVPPGDGKHAINQVVWERVVSPRLREMEAVPRGEELFRLIMQMTLEFFCRLEMTRGQEMRKIITRGGMTGYQGHLGNYSYYPAGQRLSHDFNLLEGLETLPRKSHAPCIVRDGVIGLMGSFSALIQSVLLAYVQEGDLSRLPNPMEAYLKGFFGDDEGMLGPNLNRFIENISGRYLALVRQKNLEWDGLPPKASFGEWEADFQDRVMMQTLIPVFADLYGESGFARQYPIMVAGGCLRDDLATYPERSREEVARFYGERFSRW